MIAASSTALVATEFLAGSVWVGSIVCLAVVTATARKVLDPPLQVTLFRAIGRRYASVGTGSLLVAVGAGLWLAWPPSGWSVVTDAALGLAGFLVLATGAGMAQARAMTVLRQRSIGNPDDGRAAAALVRGRRLANALRAVMAAATLGVVALGAQIASH